MRLWLEWQYVAMSGISGGSGSLSKRGAIIVSTKKILKVSVFCIVCGEISEGVQAPSFPWILDSTDIDAESLKSAN